MAELQDIHFSFPNCGDGSALLEEIDGDFNAGETYQCSGCGGPVIFVALSPEMLADPAAIRWDCHFCQPNPCRLAPSPDGTGGQRNLD